MTQGERMVIAGDLLVFVAIVGFMLIVGLGVGMLLVRRPPAPPDHREEPRDRTDDQPGPDA